MTVLSKTYQQVLLIWSILVLLTSASASLPVCNNNNPPQSSTVCTVPKAGCPNISSCFSTCHSYNFNQGSCADMDHLLCVCYNRIKLEQEDL
ncbi:MAG: hypothetical protein J3R72DRAFT_446666, partial [Linnemannia gamsii]